MVIIYDNFFLVTITETFEKVNAAMENRLAGYYSASSVGRFSLR